MSFRLNSPGVFVFLLLLLAASGATPSKALTITFEANDLMDETPGDDLWQYIYHVSDFPFDAGFGLSILFDPALYEDLQDPPPGVNADWDVISLQPDVNLPDSGLYDALALVDSPSVANAFVIDFVWLGLGTPGAQPFEVYNPSFSVIDQGITVPEPNTFGLLLLSLLGLRTLRAPCIRCRVTRSREATSANGGHSE